MLTAPSPKERIRIVFFNDIIIFNNNISIYITGKK